MTNYLDADTVTNKTSPTGTDIKASVDLATPATKTTLSYIEVGPFRDLNTITTRSGPYIVLADGRPVLPGSIETRVHPTGFYGPNDTDSGAIP